MKQALYYLKRYGIIGIPFITTIILLLTTGQSIAMWIFFGLTAAAIIQHIVRVIITVVRTNKQFDEELE